ncbi:MAG TPA: NADH-quinone oxidoreductase subunit L [Candidatus Acidoferrum sp.]|jgi:NADH-quinone oxidoreductase subunit L|nr:NADH-quinone oxidoreductase subunit L [Candidatus Acidoferrum sp.]
MFFLSNIWLIPLLPAFGAVIMFFFGRRLQKATVSAVCVGTIVLAFVMACGAVWQYSAWSSTPDNFHKPYQTILYTWLGTDTGHMNYVTHDGSQAAFQADAGFLLDPLSSIWLLFVTGVGMLIHIYSTGYMAHEGGYYRFFGYLNLFMFSMLTLILANNYVLMFVGWEGVGLCSYLLIGFYFHRKSATDAGNKAFIVNRIGDAGFLLGMFFIAWYFGSLRFTEVTHLAHSGRFAIGDPIITAATLLLFVGACGKSAQLPLYVWLPDAMEGPTPVSALIHAATMVTAGVYMVARSNALFVLAPTSMKTVAVVGALTAIFAASIGLVQNDIKRVLAYSTVSQLGYMFLALGVGAFSAGVFHVFTHAFFKALLFLGAGSVIHAMSGEQDMRNMGALRDRIPTTYWTMFIATLAIAGIPPFAGFFSKDEILWQAWTSESVAYHLLWIIGYATALMTAFYMFRLIYLTFYSKPRMSHEVEHHIHESPASMTMPLVILAVMSLFAGFLGFPQSLARLVGIHGQTNRFEAFLDPVFSKEAQVFKAEEPAQLAAGVKEEEKTSGTEYLLMLLSVGAAGLGYYMAGRAYAKADKGYTEPIAAASPPVYNLLLNKYYVDEGYDYVFTGRRKLGDVRLGVLGLGEASAWFDTNVVDGAVNAAGWITRLTATISSWWDKWIIDGIGVNGPAILARMLSYPARLFEWGLVQWYALVMTAGLVGFVFYYVYH